MSALMRRLCCRGNSERSFFLSTLCHPELDQMFDLFNVWTCLIGDSWLVQSLWWITTWWNTCVSVFLFEPVSWHFLLLVHTAVSSMSVHPCHLSWKGSLSPGAQNVSLPTLMLLPPSPPLVHVCSGLFVYVRALYVWLEKPRESG